MRETGYEVGVLGHGSITGATYAKKRARPASIWSQLLEGWLVLSIGSIILNWINTTRTYWTIPCMVIIIMDFAVHPSKNWGLYGISLTSFAKFYPCWSEMNVNRFRAIDRNLIACSAVWHLCSFLIENRPDLLENITTEENLCIPSFHVK